jgi:SPP1 family predicted phage head-tail adaptor
MQAGELDQRIIIQNYTTVRGTSGEEIATWATWKTVWASVQTTGGAENFYSPQLVAEATHKLKMRYLCGVKRTMQVLWRGKILDITHVDDESRRRQGEMYLLCKELVDCVR